MRGSDLTMVSCGWLLICSYPGWLRAPAARWHQKCQNSDGTLRSGRVVPHPAPKNVEKKSSQNGLRMYPELLPHQLRPISTYPNPPISHIGKNRKLHIFCYFSLFPRARPVLIQISGYWLDVLIAGFIRAKGGESK